MKSEILDKINKILLEKLHITIKEEYYNEDLLGKANKLASRDLLYLFFFIQEEFNISIDSKYILEGNFNTINNIIDIVHKTLQVKEKNSSWLT